MYKKWEKKNLNKKLAIFIHFILYFIEIIGTFFIVINSLIFILSFEIKNEEIKIMNQEKLIEAANCLWEIKKIICRKDCGFLITFFAANCKYLIKLLDFICWFLKECLEPTIFFVEVIQFIAKKKNSLNSFDHNELFELSAPSVGRL